MTKDRLFLDIHLIQTLPPSNVNRDDTGSPKTAQYGGVTRARVSSQAWKRAVRKYFKDEYNLENQGIRSRDIVNYLAEKIVDLDSDKSHEDALKLAEETLNKAKISTKDQKVKALFFISNKQATDLAQAALDGIKDKKILQEILRDNPSIDIYLFGRMVADDPTLNEDASCQFAHAISTHAIEREFDYFTAVDDLAREDNAGAGMLGTIEYNSSTVYRYANIALHEFKNQLDDVEACAYASRLFVEAFIKSMPTGKINSFANQTLPKAILLNLRKDRPLNLVTAFENPIKSKEGYEKKSAERLFDENTKYEKLLGDAAYKSCIVAYDMDIDNIDTRKDSIKDLVYDIEEKIKENLS